MRRTTMSLLALVLVAGCGSRATGDGRTAERTTTTTAATAGPTATDERDADLTVCEQGVRDLTVQIANDEQPSVQSVTECR